MWREQPQKLYTRKEIPVMSLYAKIAVTGIFVTTMDVEQVVSKQTSEKYNAHERWSVIYMQMHNYCWYQYR